ncbi:phosphatase 2C-like domain-containing protein [Scenedesmus sp. NREL 46B-D3]|nr:phosphatase 2C-like domain-containing protein [Scenedesmus sp. NREL 46B-D3]
MQTPGMPTCDAEDSQTVHNALPLGVGSKATLPSRSVKFAEHTQSSADTPVDAEACPPRVSLGGSSTNGGGGCSDQVPRLRGRVPGRSQSSLNFRAPPDGAELSGAVLAKQADILRANKMGKLRQRRGGLDSSFAAMQDALATTEKPLAHVSTRAAGLKHIGFGPFKRENQDEFYIQIGKFGGLHSSNLFCVFDGHGTHGKNAALYSRQLLPRLLDAEVTKYFKCVTYDSGDGLKGAVELLITEAFGETERSLSKIGVNLVNSGTTASVAYQQGNRLVRDQWRALPLTIDHRPCRDSERERIEAAGAVWRPSGCRLAAQSLGDLTAATVGCTSDPEVSFTTLRHGVDHMLVMASDGVWDVLSNEQVCDIVVESPDPHIACRRVLDAALYEWEERMSADNITVLVVEFDWSEDGSHSASSMDAQALASSSSSSGRAEDLPAPVTP